MERGSSLTGREVECFEGLIVQPSEIFEALHNAQKHSGVKRIKVQLQEQPSEIHLTVHDSGRGFDLETAKQGKGLGLTSMRERVRLVNGTISIESKPLGGTTIHVRVPLESKHAAKRGAV